MATAYVARFTRRILGVVGLESRATSPRPGIEVLPTNTNSGDANGHGNGNGNGNGLGNGNQGHSDSDFLAELVSYRELPSFGQYVEADQQGAILANTG